MAVKIVIINTTIAMMIMMGLIMTVIADLKHPATCTGSQLSKQDHNNVEMLVQKLQYEAAHDDTNLRASGTEYTVKGEASCTSTKTGRNARMDDCMGCLKWGVGALSHNCNQVYSSYVGATESGGTCEMSYGPIA